jgi:hypothetical protein
VPAGTSRSPAFRADWNAEVESFAPVSSAPKLMGFCGFTSGGGVGPTPGVGAGDGVGLGFLLGVPVFATRTTMVELPSRWLEL